MDTYNIMILREPHGFTARCPAFDVTVDSDDYQQAYLQCMHLAEIEGLGILGKGGTLPADPLANADFDMLDGAILIQWTSELEKTFREQHLDTVRRNISLPGWMDLKLRYYGIDASRLFQDAAQERITQCESKPGAVRIGNISELMGNVDKKILDDYFEARLKSMLQKEMEG